ncbi:c-type cytochrome biogenesis protein CcmI [Chelativorans sp. Marseille-P2723]|uniref:c-type cytochrome biogenesis protein CcmI n=1 Tax=Chelativorans sp. Marseille-P2723 TaxID=2709133 RepID=UPI00157040A9|nr:c-type cytochrome biogenesis protein CcmI [Chelativorans sp. Marseille-P2723]
MVFWVLAALLTFGASIAVLGPFLRTDERRAAGAEHDLTVYRDQLIELEQEVRRGMISQSDAAEARAEIGRRILRLKEGGTTEDGQPQKLSGIAVKVFALVMVLAVPVVSWGLYAFLGSPELQSAPLAARLTQDPAQASMEELIVRAERHLAANPDDVRGWETLGPIYLRLGRYQDAVAAYRRAIEFGGSTPEREAALGEALVGEKGGLVTAEAEAAFLRALAVDNASPRARFFIAVARAQEGRNEEAGAIWEEMAAGLPENSPWRGAAEQALVNLANLRREGSALSEGTKGGIPEEELAAVENMTQEERQEMIEAMVASLDTRLRENPADLKGWQRLLRSYVVLGRTNEAEKVLARAVAALGDQSQEARELVQFATGLGISEEER